MEGKKRKSYGYKIVLFVAGSVFTTGVQSLRCDILGKEKVLRLTEIMWVDAVYTVPLALVMMVGALLAYAFTDAENG